MRADSTPPHQETRRQAQRSTRTSRKTSTPVERQPRILVIEDDTNTREALTLLLRYYDYKVTAASDGVEALSMLKELAPDLVVMDWRMPGLSGIPLCMALRRARETMPIIVVTSSVGSFQREPSINAWLRKPIDPPLLDQVIRHELSNAGDLNHE